MTDIHTSKHWIKVGMAFGAALWLAVGFTAGYFFALVTILVV